jgi:hypothetical protein
MEKNGVGPKTKALKFIAQKYNRLERRYEIEVKES